jgi:hypothetical protein
MIGGASTLDPPLWYVCPQLWNIKSCTSGISLLGLLPAAFSALLILRICGRLIIAVFGFDEEVKVNNDLGTVATCTMLPSTLCPLIH